MSLHVVRAGLRPTVQDLGRPGYAALGVSPSGAADRAALRLGNRLLGNAEGAAGLECPMGALVLRADAPHWCAVTGADVDVRIDGRHVGSGVAVFVGPGSTLEVGTPRRGLRAYVTVSGGLDTPLVLGSRSEDTLGRLVPTPIAEGTVLPVGSPDHRIPGADHPHGSALPGPGPLTLPVVAGPRRDWLEDESWDVLLRATFTVSDRLDRIGVRLDGPALRRSITDELPSEGLIRGAVQLPPSGSPIVFLADHPTTGGYPVVAVVEDDATDVLAQALPGQPVRFQLSSDRPTHRRLSPRSLPRTSE